MIIVKITILLIVITVLMRYMVKIFFSVSEEEAIRIETTGVFPKWTYLLGLLLILDNIGIIASAIYLLFIR